MKIRNGFVTNSSSSSFIISVKENSEIKGNETNLEIALKRIIKDTLEVGNKLNSVEDLNTEIDTEYYDVQESSDALERMKQLINSGYTLYKYELSTDEYEHMRHYYILNSLVENNVIEIVWGDLEY